MNFTNFGSVMAFCATVSLIGASCSKDKYKATPQPAGYAYVFDDNFDYDAHNWSFYDAHSNAEVSVANGTLAYTYYPGTAGTNTIAVDPGADLTRNFLIQTSIKTDNIMGFTFGVSNGNYGYSFIVNANGSYAVFKEGSASIPVQTIIDWTHDPAVHSGWNDMEIEQYNGRWTGYINNTKLFDIAAYTTYGDKVGFIVLDGTTGYADYLTVKW